MDRTKLSTQDGTQIEGYVWKPEGPAKAVVIQSHGIGEHGERYDHVAKAFNAEGIGFFAYDHRGHGRSGGKRGHINSYGELLEELDLARAEASKLFGDVPQILYGHSWGATISLNYLIRNSAHFKAAIITSPWLILPKEQAPSPFLFFLAKVMNSIYPAFTEDNKIDTSQLSSDLEVGKAYEKDPLVHGRVTARNFIQSNDAAAVALERGPKISLPMLLMHGSDDKITSPEGSKAFAEKAGENVQFKIWDGFRHETHNEQGKEQVIGKMLDFVKAQLA